MLDKFGKRLVAAVLSATVALAVSDLLVAAQDAKSVLGPTDKDVEKAEQLFAKGHRAFDNRDLKGAESLYRKAIEINGSESRFHRQLCLLLLAEGRGQEAEREALFATKADPGDWKSQLVLGRVYHAGNRIDEEVTVYKKVLAILPEDMKGLRSKLEEFIKQDEQSVKSEQSRLKKKKEWEEREFKNAY